LLRLSPNRNSTEENQTNKQEKRQFNDSMHSGTNKQTKSYERRKRTIAIMASSNDVIPLGGLRIDP
jgi:hypothetical protein